MRLGSSIQFMILPSPKNPYLENLNLYTIRYSIDCEDKSSQRRSGAQQAGVRGRVKSPAEMFVLQKWNSVRQIKILRIIMFLLFHLCVYIYIWISTVASISRSLYTYIYICEFWRAFLFVLFIPMYIYIYLHIYIYQDVLPCSSRLNL